MFKLFLSIFLVNINVNNRCDYLKIPPILIFFDNILLNNRHKFSIKYIKLR